MAHARPRCRSAKRLARSRKGSPIRTDPVVVSGAGDHLADALAPRPPTTVTASVLGAHEIVACLPRDRIRIAVAPRRLGSIVSHAHPTTGVAVGQRREHERSDFHGIAPMGEKVPYSRAGPPGSPRPTVHRAGSGTIDSARARGRLQGEKDPIDPQSRTGCQDRAARTHGLRSGHERFRRRSVSGSSASERRRPDAEPSLTKPPRGYRTRPAPCSRPGRCASAC